MPDRPNILFILADDMGYGDFGATSGGLSETPALDVLMAENLCLTQHYAASPVCNPSRAALLTGRYPHRTGSIDTLEWRGLERLALREVTLADLLQRAGYATGLVGKWHLGAFDPRYRPKARGFQETVCFRGGMHDYWQWRIEVNDQPCRADGRYLTDVWTDEALAFLERHHRDPFFLHVTYNAPHTPLQCPEEDVKPFADTGKFTRAVSTVYGMIRRMDHGVGRILERLERLGLAENTIVIFTSDNGPAFGGQGEDCQTRFNCDWAGHKGVVYEGGIRVPAIVRWPAGGIAGRRDEHAMVHFCDWMPTLLAAAGLEPPRDRTVDGGDVLPVLRGEGGATCTRRFWQWNRYTPRVEQNAAMRDGPWKLVRPGVHHSRITPQDNEWLRTSMYNYDYFLEHGVVRERDPGLDRPAPAEPQLFNLDEDPHEARDLSAREPARLARMLGDLQNWFDEVEAERRTIADAW